MKIDVIREKFANSFTRGRLFINGEYFCDTIEDTDRGLKQVDGAAACLAKKIAGRTAIPTGHYNVYITFSPKYQKQMPLINAVPAFDGIRIHSGNTAADTEGCILVGKYNNAGCVIQSRDHYNQLFAKMQEAFKRGEAITIEITHAAK